MREPFMTRYVRFALRRRGAVLAVCALVSALALASLTRAEIATTLGELFLGESPAYRSYLARSAEFGGDEVLIVGVEAGPEVLAGPERERLEDALARVRAVAGVGRVHAASEAPVLVPGPLGAPRPMPAAEAAGALGPKAVWSALQGDPFAGGLLVGRDGRSLAVIVELGSDPDRPAEEAIRLLREVPGAFVAAGFAPERLHVSGLVAMVGEILRETVFALATLLPAVALVLLFVVWLAFRRFWPAALSLGVAALGVLWTMGFAVALDPRVNVLMAIVPAVVLIVSFSDVVHLCSAYLLELEAGIGRDEAIVAAGGDVGAACVLTSLTTFVGFVCLSLVPAPAFRVMGVVLGCGVAIALLQAVTLVPVLFSFGPAPAPLRAGPTAVVQRALDRALRASERAALGRPWVVIGAFALLLGLSLWGATGLRIETDFARRFDRDHPLQVDQRWFEARFAGWNPIDVFVEAPDPGRLREPAWLARVAAFQEEVARLPEVEATSSALDLFAVWRRATTGAPGGSLADALPTGRAELEGALALLAATGGRDVARLIDLERGRLRLLLRLGPAGFRTTAAVAAQVRAIAARHLAGEGTVEVTGITPLLGDWLDEIVAGQRSGFALSALTIAAVMILVLRSLAAGLAAMVPNLLPLLFVAGWVGATWEQVDSDVLIIGMLAIGIGVDDTIHFLTRYRVEVARGAEAAEAVRRTFAFAGRGIVITTAILVAGFLPFATSSYLTLQMFGTLLPASLVAALLADVLLVPAMIRVGSLASTARESAPPSQGLSEVGGADSP